MIYESEGYYRGTKKVCAHCREREVSIDIEIGGEHELCDRCWKEINDNEIIGWGKGE